VPGPTRARPPEHQVFSVPDLAPGTRYFRCELKRVVPHRIDVFTATKSSREHEGRFFGGSPRAPARRSTSAKLRTGRFWSGRALEFTNRFYILHRFPGGRLLCLGDPKSSGTTSRGTACQPPKTHNELSWSTNPCFDGFSAPKIRLPQLHVIFFSKSPPRATAGCNISRCFAATWKNGQVTAIKYCTASVFADPFQVPENIRRYLA